MTEIRPIPGIVAAYGVSADGSVWSRHPVRVAGAVALFVAGVRWRLLGSRDGSYTVRSTSGAIVYCTGESLRADAWGDVRTPKRRGPSKERAPRASRARPDVAAKIASDRVRDAAIRDIMRILDCVGMAGACALLGIDEATIRLAGVGREVIEGAADLARRCEAGEMEGWARRERRARLDGLAQVIL